MSFPSRKQLAIALSISLALNLFIAGFLVARALRDERSGGRGTQVAAMHSPRALVRAADAAGARKQARRVMGRHRSDFRQRRRAMRQAQQQAQQALTAEPFDEGALGRALSDVQARTADTQGVLHAAFVEMAKELSPEQRRAMARALRRANRRDGPAKGKGRKGRKGQ